MSTNYNRYLDLHLCTTTNIADLKTRKAAPGDRRKFFSHGGTEYFYEFRDDMQKQSMYRSVKNEGFTFDPDAWFSKGNSRNFSDFEITSADVSMLRLRLGRITDELKQMRYIGCMLSMEKLQGIEWLPNLEGLMHWICDETTTNKLRINCHGAGTSTGGFHMGNNDLSVETLVRRLVFHGLSRGQKVKQDTFGLAHSARWKLDAEVTRCENTACGQQFSKTWYGSSTKHHCRRCGGIFCDRCSSKRIDLRVALTGPNNATAKNVKNARVCDPCFKEAFDVDDKFWGEKGMQEVFGRDAAGSELKYGLQTIALGLCMGAKADDRFSPQLGTVGAGTFEAGSLAARLRDELGKKNIHGIKITASNQVVGFNEEAGLKNQFGVKYPQDGGKRDVRLGQSRATISFPAYIWGTDPILKSEYDNLPDPKPAPGIVAHGNKLYFGLNQFPLPRPSRVPGGRAMAVAPNAVAQPNSRAVVLRILVDFYKDWKFTSWGMTPVPYSTVSGQSDSMYFMLSPPPRVTLIQGDNPVPPAVPQAPAPNSEIRVTGRQVDTYKLTKSYGMS